MQGIAALMVTLGFGVLSSLEAKAECPNHSMSCRPSFVAPESKGGGGVQIDGLVSGQVVDTGREVYIVGATIRQHNVDKPAINVRGSHRKVVLSGVDVVSERSSVVDRRGMAAVISIQSDISNARVKLDGLRVKANNVQMSADSQGSLSCAAILCVQFASDHGGQFVSRNSRVKASGHTKLDSHTRR